MAVEQADTRRATNPLFNDNRMKLGVFGANVSNGCAITLAEGRLETSWPNTKRIATLADRAGLEAMVPVARWKGFGGPTNFNGACFETYTWAAGVAGVTEHTGVFSTSHVPTVHPIMAAKQGTTIDHISNGRFALNVVCGWFQPELEMFGAPIMEHDTRYEYAAEWLEVVKRLWTAEDEFDYEGRFFRIQKGFHQPKPIQKPFPPIMNAGGSATGRRFAAKYADMAFVVLQRHDYDGVKAQVDALRNLARDEFRREVQVWSSAYVVCRPTEQEATDYLNYYVRERGDWEAVETLTRVMGIQAETLPPEAMEAFKFHFIAGWGGYPLVGTPEQIVDKLAGLARAGMNGVVLSWVNYEAELQQWIAEVLPLMEQAGLRQPFRPEA
ncbi:MAG TPA: LLM class flavin-dependent oxidoreductase [Chloroflexota bacterium]|nr:LLM class flavin-dependent oxidoreductase [Chloroflexota bacterium]